MIRGRCHLSIFCSRGTPPRTLTQSGLLEAISRLRQPLPPSNSTNRWFRSIFFCMKSPRRSFHPSDPPSPAEPSLPQPPPPPTSSRPLPPPAGDTLRVGWLNGSWEGCRESRCSRDTYPESYITKYTSMRRKIPAPDTVNLRHCSNRRKPGSARHLRTSAVCW